MVRDELEKKMAVLLGGRAAEHLIFDHLSHRRGRRPEQGHRDRPQHGHPLRDGARSWGT